jgi:hypothetical protein
LYYRLVRLPLDRCHPTDADGVGLYGFLRAECARQEQNEKRDQDGHGITFRVS